MSKEPKYKTFYALSPRLEKDENGKPYIHRPEAPAPVEVTAPMVDEAFDRERMDMITRHMREAADLYSKHVTVKPETVN